MPNKLFYGDNLSVLRESIGTESVDLVYLDPPFNSNASYNVLFKAPSGEQSQAQIEAFEDTWHWNDSAEKAFDEVVTGPPPYHTETFHQNLMRLRDNSELISPLPAGSGGGEGKKGRPL